MKRLLALTLCALLLLGGMALGEGATDGKYTVTSPGFYGELNVTVVIEGGAISDIVVKDCPETPELGGKAIEMMTMEMIDNNTSGVDSVSGATVTSAYFRRAVNAALLRASEVPASILTYLSAPSWVSPSFFSSAANMRQKVTLWTRYT